MPMRSILVLALAAATAAAAPPPPSADLIARLELREAPQPVRERAGWRPPKRIVVQSLGDDIVAALRPVAPDAQFVVVNTADEARAAVADADVLLGSGARMCTPAVFAAAKKLRWMQTYSAGVERCVSDDAFRKRGALLTNMQRAYGPVIAEHVIAMMLALTRELPTYTTLQSQRRWDTSPTARMQTVEGKTMLVVGLGGIGTEVAERAHGLRMRVVATRARRGADRPAFVERVGTPDELPALIREADVVVNALPLTAETRGLFDAAMFARMRSTALFINVGRGQTVRTEDLVAALERGVIGGAGLDVVDPEPLPPEHPLWRAPNLLVTPHVAGDAKDYDRVLIEVVRENLRRYVAGERMLSVVDSERGY